MGPKFILAYVGPDLGQNISQDLNLGLNLSLNLGLGPKYKLIVLN